MLINTENDVFLHVPSQSKQRVLHPCRIQEGMPNHIALQSRENFFAVEVGMKVVFYYHDTKGHFYKQNARVEESIAPPPMQVVGIQPADEPVSAESRQHYRVSTVLADLFIDLDQECRCQMLDISTVGLAALSTRAYDLGDILQVKLYHSGQIYEGGIAVQSIRELEPGKFRYGFHGMDEKARNDNLAKGLHLISMSMQREQLRRLSGTKPTH